MIKKITALVLCFAMLFSIQSFATTFTDVQEDGSEKSEAIKVLSELGIISGMGNGSFSPYTNLTRAQFAKIAVCIMGKTNEAVATTAAFADVKATDWFSGYVNVVAKEGIISGYPDGRFGADEPITYAQAITVLVRLLGYSASDVGHKWPQGYLDKASVLEITKDITFDYNAPITRGDAAMLIYRTLFTDMKGTKTALITKMDKNVYEDTLVIATKKENTSLLDNQVQCDAGVFKYDENVVDVSQFVGYEGTMVVDDENSIIAFVPSADMTKTVYTVAAIYTEGNSKSISVIADEGNVTLDNNLAMYIGGEKSTAANLSLTLNPGSTISLFELNGTLKYAFVDEYKYRGPKVYVSDDVFELFDIEDKENVKVIRDGISSDVESLDIYDVLYYSARTNTVYAYTDRVTGMYEEAYPMKNNVTRVTVSGSEYTLSTLDAVNKLNETEGAFQIGDRVTLLFGENGSVVDAVSLTDADYSMYGVVTGSGTQLSDKEDSKGRTEYYVNILHADGKMVKYVVENDDYFDSAGELCTVDFENSFAVLSFVKTSTVTGFVNADMRFIGTQKMSDEVKILEYVDGTDESATVVKLNLSDIDSLKLEKKDVKCVVYNQKGEIEVIYLDDVTGNNDIYGVIIHNEVVEDARGNKSGTYTVLCGNEEYKVSGVYYPALNNGDCVRYVKTASETSLIEVAPIDTGSKIESIVDNIITVNGKKYTLSDDAVIYAGKTSGKLRTITWLDADSLAGKVAIYSDKTIYTGGKITVVRIFTE